MFSKEMLFSTYLHKIRTRNSDQCEENKQNEKHFIWLHFSSLVLLISPTSCAKQFSSLWINSFWMLFSETPLLTRHYNDLIFLKMYNQFPFYCKVILMCSWCTYVLLFKRRLKHKKCSIFLTLQTTKKKIVFQLTRSWHDGIHDDLYWLYDIVSIICYSLMLW